jgi:FtsH-binding integral membrane protein
MDYVASFFDSRSSSWNYASLRNFNKLSSPVQSHLQKVYLTLAAALLVSALGVYVHTLWHIGGLITSLGFIATTAWLVSTPSTPAEEGKRLKLLAAAAFFEGASVGTLVEAVLQFDPSIVVMAFLGSVAVFACFSGAALVARRREYLFLGGILSSVVSLMLLLQFSSLIFGRSAFMYNVEV